jgi:imidazolonepropionase-like amidohydrolase
MGFLRFGALLSVFSLLLNTATAQTVPPVAITNVNVIDVLRGQVIPAQTVVVADGRVSAVGPAASTAVPGSARRIAGDGRYLIPGLWDMHVHLRSDQAKPDIRIPDENAATLDLFLPNGIVGIREMGGDLAPQVFQWRDEIRAGKRPGPRILTAGRKLDSDPPTWAGSIGVKTEADAREAVRQMKHDGADFIKVYFGRIPVGILRAAVDEAHKNGLKVTGHKPTNLSIQEFLETGIDGMEHSQYLVATDRTEYDKLNAEAARRLGKDWNMDPAERSARMLAMQDDKEGAVVWKSMADKPFWVTPTVFVSSQVVQEGTRDYESDGRKRYMPPSIWASWDSKGFRKPVQGRNLTIRTAELRRWAETTLAAFQAGVPMLVGTDCGSNNNYTMPGWSLTEEMQALVRVGLTPAEVLRAATVNAAKWRGESDREGTVEAGKTADLVLLRANPLENIQRAKEIDAVFQSGRYYGRADLDAMLQRAEENVARFRKKAN